MAGIEIVTDEDLYACFCNPTAKMEKDREEEIFLRVIENTGKLQVAFLSRWERQREGAFCYC